jgi:hypothetical protein
MPDTKLTNMTADTSPSTDDIIYTVNDPSGTPASRKVTLANIATLFWNYLTSLTAKTTLVDADQLGLADSAASNVGKKITWQNVMVQAAAYTQTLTNKTLTAPTIADFTNAAHDHGDADDGGVLVAAAVGLTTQGDILYRDASGLARLGAGTSGQYLKTLGAGANPVWDTPAGGGGSGDAGMVFALS